MKQSVIKLSVIIFLAGIIHSVSAQTEAGNILISGITGFSYVSTSGKAEDNFGESVNSSTMEFSPQAGIFYLKNCLIGLAIQYNSKTLKTNVSDSRSSSVAAMPVAMFYIGKERIKPFVYGGMGFGKSTSSRNNYYYLEENKLTSFEAGFGLAAFISENISLDIGAAYTSIKTKQEDTKLISNGFGFQVGFSIYL